MPQPIAFSLSPQTIYITSDPTQNVLVLTLVNRSGAALTLTGGTPVPESSIEPNDPTTFYFSFGDLISDSELQGISVSASGWNACFFSGTFTNWGVSPASDISIPDQGTVTFTINKLLASGQPAPGQMSFDYYNFSSVSNGTTQTPVFLENPPRNQADLQLTKSFVEGDTVYTTLDPDSPILNTLYFALSNPSVSQPVVSQPWANNPPTFNISFLYANPPGYGALTTAQLGAKISVNVAAANQGNWSVTPDASGDFWVLQPTTSNPEVFAPAASVELEISAIRTDFPVGSSPDITNIYVQYVNLPGYNDGFFSAQIVKVAGPAITSFFSDPLSLVSESSPGTVYWSTKNVSEVSFEGGGIAPNFYKPAGNLPATITAGAGITITASLNASEGARARDGQSAGPSVSRTIDPASVEVATLTLPFAGATGIVLFNDTAFVFQGYLEANTAKYAVVDLATNQITAACDLAAVIDPSLGPDFGITGLAVTPDGATIYALVQTCPDGAPNHLLLIAIDIATNSPAVVLDLGDLGAVLMLADLAVTPDGSTIYLSYCGWGTGTAGLFTISTSSYTVTNEYSYADVPAFAALPAPGLFGVSSDGSNAFIAGWAALASMDIANGFTLTSQWVVLSTFPDFIFAPVFDAINSTGTQAFFLAGPLDGDQCDQFYVLPVNIDPTKYTFSYGGSLIPVDVPGKINPLNPLTFGPGDTHVYFAASSSVLLIDAATLVSTSIEWGTAERQNQAIAVDLTRPNVIYVSAGSDWTTLTVTPWPFQTAPSAAPAARHFRSRPRAVLPYLAARK